MVQKKISGKKYFEYPLYIYYKDGSMSLNQIMTHYNQRFYLIDFDKAKSQKVLDTIFSLKKFSNLSYRSTRLKIPLNCVEILHCINSSLWFKFQSNKTKTLGVLIAACLWEEKVNSVISIIDSTKFRNDILTIFEKLNIIAELTEEEYLNDTIPGRKEKEIIEAKMAYEKKKLEEMSSFTHSWGLSEYCSKNSIVEIKITEIEGKTVFSLITKGGHIAYAIPSVNLSYERTKNICQQFFPELLWNTYDSPSISFIRIGLIDNPKDSVIRYVIYDDEETRKLWTKSF